MNLYLHTLFLLFSLVSSINTRLKVVGIFTIPNRFIRKTLNIQSQMGMVNEFYYNFIIQSGTRAIAIPYWAPQTYLKKIFRQTDGLLFQGGVSSYLTWIQKNNISHYIFQKNIQFIIQLAVQENQKHRQYPILGICMGFEQLLIYFNGGDYRVLSTLDNFGNYYNLIPTKHYFTSNPYKQMTDVQQHYIIDNQYSSYFSHKYGIYLQDYLQNKLLRSAFKATALAKIYVQRQQKYIVASIEHRKYPFIGFQTHPEKFQFMDQKSHDVPVSNMGAIISQQISMAFVNMMIKKEQKGSYRQYDLFKLVPTIDLKHFYPKFYIFKYWQSQSWQKRFDQEFKVEHD